MDCFTSIKPDLEPDFTPAAYNKLLSTLFPVNSPYTVFPRVHQKQWQNNTSAAPATFIVYYERSPIFLLDLYEYSSLARISSREAADNNIRAHMRDLLPYCPLPTLHGVSVFGTRMAFYTAAAGSAISPNRTSPSSNNELEDMTPADWWDCDLLEDDGAIRLKEVVNKIRNQCENLG